MTGKRTNVHIPGEGTVYLDVGLILTGFDEFGDEVVLLLTAGKQVDSSLGQILCPYFFPTT